MGKKLENLWVIPRHAVRARNICETRISAILSLHNFPGFLGFCDRRRLVDSRTGPCGFPIGSHMGPRPMNSVWALKGPYDLSRHRMALLLKQLFVDIVDHVQVLRNPYGPRTSSYD